MNFKHWLNEAAYLDPDIFWKDKNSITFIYTNEHRLYYHSDPLMSHRNLICTNAELRERYMPYITKYPHATEEDNCNLFRRRAESLDLLGRIGFRHDEYWVASFWGHSKVLFDKLLKDCLQELIHKKLLSKEDFVSTPIHKTIPIEQILGGTAKEQEIDQDKLELAKKMHLLRGQEKQDAMKKLGVGGRKDHPIQTSLDKAGLRIPGQKWWALNSENVLH